MLLLHLLGNPKIHLTHFVKYQKHMGVCGPNFSSFTCNACSVWGTAWSVLGVLDSFNPPKTLIVRCYYLHLHMWILGVSGIVGCGKCLLLKLGLALQGETMMLRGYKELWRYRGVGSRPCNKVNIAISWISQQSESNEFLGFPEGAKVTFTQHRSQVSVQ